MQLTTMPNEKEKFVVMRSKQKLQKFLIDEYEYISNLLVSLDVPDSVHGNLSIHQMKFTEYNVQ